MLGSIAFLPSWLVVGSKAEEVRRFDTAVWVERGGEGRCSQLSIMPRMEGSGGAAHSGSSPLGLLLVVGIVRHSVLLLSSNGISGDGDD